MKRSDDFKRPVINLAESKILKNHEAIAPISEHEEKLAEASERVRKAGSDIDVPFIHSEQKLGGNKDNLVRSSSVSSLHVYPPEEENYLELREQRNKEQGERLLSQGVSRRGVEAILKKEAITKIKDPRPEDPTIIRRIRFDNEGIDRVQGELSKLKTRLKTEEELAKMLKKRQTREPER